MPESNRPPNPEGHSRDVGVNADPPTSGRRRGWPSVSANPARAELEAMRLLTEGATPQDVATATGLTETHVRRLARLNARERKDPKEDDSHARPTRRSA